jgi:glycosyltransferase involved in cell wall biosynthesis
MKILHLPHNTSSQVSVTVQALRALGQDARGLVQKHTMLQDCEGLETMEWTGRPPPLRRLARGIRWRARLIRATAWADVIHWNTGSSTWKGLDLRIAALLNKPRLVEFWGEELRDPALASRDNPFVARMYESNPELRHDRSRRNQQLFRKHGFACLIPGTELQDYLDPGIYPEHFSTRQRVRLAAFEPQYPQIDQKRPLVVHAPSSKARKGTEAVLAAVGQLRKICEFEFHLIHQLPRHEALNLVRHCDVFLDQFTIGAEGLASIEAMAFGKPVVCFIKPSLWSRYPPEFPIVTADQNQLTQVMEALLLDAGKRHEIGRRSRQYVETYHDSRVVAAGLMKVYEALLARAKPGGPGFR